MDQMTCGEFIAILDRISEVMTEKEKELCEMDAQMGDGDLGITMRKGWQAVSKVAHEMDESDIGKLLIKCGMKMSSAVPSTMGTLIASGLMSGGKAVSGKTEISINEFSDFLQGFCDGIIRRGKCQPGDRTVLDSLWPAAQEAKKQQRLTVCAIQAIQFASDEGLEKTRRMVPKFGKAAVFAAKANGIADQGAVVGNLIITCFCDHFKLLCEKKQ